MVASLRPLVVELQSSVIKTELQTVHLDAHPTFCMPRPVPEPIELFKDTR